MTALTGALTANFISFNVFGLKVILPITYQYVFQPLDYWKLIPLGLIVGGLGYLYNQLLLQVPLWFAKVKIIPGYLLGIIPMLLMIPVGGLFAETIGGGSELIMLIAQHQVAVSMLVFYLVLRVVLGLTAYGTGIPGGFFMPVLTVGALIGMLYGVEINNLGLLSQNYTINLLVFGMAGFFTAVSKAPLTSIILITELVGSTHNFMALTIVVLVAYLVTDALGGLPIYQALAARITKIKKYQNSNQPTDEIELAVYPFSKVANELVKKIIWPEDTILIKINRGNQVIIPNGQTRIKVGDTLTVLVHSDNYGYSYRKLQDLTIKYDD